MILLPPLNLFFYNVLLGLVDCQYKKTMDGPVFEPRFWHNIPIIKAFTTIPEPGFPAPVNILPDMNPYVNALILLPAIFKNKYLKVLLGFILMWNFVVCKRFVMYYIELLTFLWKSDLNWLYFSGVVVAGLIFNLGHVSLMYYTAKRPVRQALIWRRNR